ncbi:integral membrane sensor signal transduction histidine kinase [Candidatus Desulfofervidus auxilii]|uniref:histidine kinase n=1 Tax=Desulfofervidus auxilii TaxID=1621989 RepID=A0A7U4QMT8_DESA2|nr:HAMP domain-containing sensor histidine kinase [Candidatus Desulfofervidus auxilii]AMM42238.1 integral membrane sensor signal transduction histidine kinase [Candidatus Desulfofervidus auxilii]
MKVTIFKRLVISYLVIILLIIFLGVYTTLRLNRLNQIINYIISVDTATVKVVGELTDTIFTQVGYEEKYLISKDQDFYQRFWEIGDYVKKNIKKLEEISDTVEKKNLIKKIKKAHESYISLFEKKVFSAVQNTSDKAYREYKQKKQNIINEISQNLREIAEIAKLDRDKKMEMASAISLQVIKVTTITAGIAIMMVVLISFLNTRNINRPILLLQEKTKQVAKGKFGPPVYISSPPEIKELANAFNTMCERLKELDEMKIDFISHLSHELRTPLTAIKEASSMLLEGVFTDMPEKQYELFSIIKEECERLINGVNRILDLSRMEAGMMSYKFRTFSLFPIIEKSTLKLTPLAQRKKIKIEMNIEDNLPLVRIDEERITQVIENLLSNAIKFTADGGKISISANKNEGNMITVSVTDTGCGIPQEELEKVFEKFKRIESGWVAVRGTGLGLSIAKHIITAHGGQIWVESEPGKGSTFYFTLPVS